MVTTSYSSYPSFILPAVIYSLLLKTSISVAFGHLCFFFFFYCFIISIYEGDHSVSVLLFQTDFTEHNSLQIHPHSNKVRDSVFSYSLVVFHYECFTVSLYSSLSLGLFSFLFFFVLGRHQNKLQKHCYHVIQKSLGAVFRH